MHSVKSSNSEFVHQVLLTWERNPNWPDICAWTVEHFGLPGQRYITVPSEHYMYWKFIDQRDQLLFVTAWGNDQ